MMRRFRVKVEGRTFDVEVEEVSATAGGQSVDCPPPAASASRQPPAGQRSCAPGQVVSPIPGKVLKIMAQPGRMVMRGEALMVIESMKIENPILAPSDGSVREILVTTGAQVCAGDLLVVLG